MEFYLTDILDIVIEYIHRNKKKNELVNKFFNPIISFININKRYYKFYFCKKYIEIPYEVSNIELPISNTIIKILNEYINDFIFPNEFQVETFLEIVRLFIFQCKNIIKNINNEIVNEMENNFEINNYHTDLNNWIKNDLFEEHI